MPVPITGSSRERVNHPAHYGGEDNPYETIKIIESLGIGYEFCVGNVIKYLMRAGKKTDDPVEDLDKADWYLNRAIVTRLARLGRDADPAEPRDVPDPGILEEWECRRDRGFPVDGVGRREST